MIGSVVGNYKIIEKIGEGGMGSVFKGVDVMLDREVAIKGLRPELARKPDLLARFRSEAVTLAKLNHPNIATLFSFFRSGEDFYMVMEFVDGPTLDDIIRDSKAMPAVRAVPLFCQALEGIEHAHNMGILHRDIKPANIMVSSQNVVKVTDFGIARVLGEAGMTRQGAVVGTIEYMSPERIQGQEIDRRSDIYALGVVLYEMLTGRGLFSTTSEYELMRAQVERPPAPPREYEPGIPQAVEAVIMRSLAKKPDYRIPTAAEFQQSLWTAMEPQGVAPRGSRPTPVPLPAETPRPKETVFYEPPPAASTPPPPAAPAPSSPAQPPTAASTPAPPPPASPPVVAPSVAPPPVVPVAPAPATRFVAEAAPSEEAPSARPPAPSEQPAAPAAAVVPPAEQPAPVGQQAKPQPPPTAYATYEGPTPSSVAETVIAPPAASPPAAPSQEVQAAPPRPPAAASGESPVPQQAVPQQAVPQQAASPVIAAPTLASIGTEHEASRWKLYLGLAAAMVVVALVGWALVPGASEPEVRPIASDTPEGPSTGAGTPGSAPSGSGATAAGGPGASPATGGRPSIPPGTPAAGAEGRRRADVDRRPPPPGGPGRGLPPPPGARPPPRKRPPPPRVAGGRVAEGAPTKVPPAPPAEQAPPPQALSPEEVAAAAERARQRLREEALKALEK